MNNHDKYELPKPTWLLDDDKVVWHPDVLAPTARANKQPLYTENDLRAAIEADRKRRGEQRVIGRIKLDGNKHPRAELSTGYDENGDQWKEGTPIYAAPHPAEPEPCFCDRMYPDSNPDASCGDCPTRDYKKPAEPVSQHPDDAAVDAFAASMKAKLAKKRDEGRGGWQMCSAGYLSRLLREYVEKGDPVDVANLAMMLHQNGQRIEPADPSGAQNAIQAPQPSP